MAHWTKFEAYQKAADNAKLLRGIYRCCMSGLADESGFVIVGELRIPRPRELFLNRARVVACMTSRIELDGPRLIVKENRGKWVPELPESIRERMEAAYLLKLPVDATADLCLVTPTTVERFFQQIEMRDWKRQRAEEKLNSNLKGEI